MYERHIHERVESEIADAPPPEPAPLPGGHCGDRESRPSPVTVPFLSPWFQHSLHLSSRFLPPYPGSLHPSPGYFLPSALWLLPFGDAGRGDGGVLGHLVMPLPLLDTDTSTVRMEGKKCEEGGNQREIRRKSK